METTTQRRLAVSTASVLTGWCFVFGLLDKTVAMLIYTICTAAIWSAVLSAHDRVIVQRRKETGS